VLRVLAMTAGGRHPRAPVRIIAALEISEPRGQAQSDGKQDEDDPDRQDDDQKNHFVLVDRRQAETPPLIHLGGNPA
jgi:hypothetical protein